MITTIIFIIVLAVLIFVHELGHFIVARLAGIRVDAFKIGFGPKVFSWKRGETEYGLNLIPFGGYVKIYGENPEAEHISGPDAARSMVNKPRWKQVAVLVAGVTFNFIFAWVLYTIVFTSGVTATTDGFEKYAQDFTNQRVMVTFVGQGSPAEKAGLAVGDIITGVVDSSSTISISNIQQLVNQHQDSAIGLKITRKDGAHTIQATPEKGIVVGAYAIGIGMDYVGDLRLPFFTAVWEGLHYTGVMIRDTTYGLYTFVAHIFQGTAHLSDVSGPVGIAGLVGNAAELGFTYLLMITALISINLGVINLVPFPALDGGRVLFTLIEAIIRRRIPETWTNGVNTVGFVLLMLLMVVVTYKDIAKLFK